MKKSKKISPIEELRSEKEQLKSEFTTTEEKILSHINYVADNFGSILLNAFIGSFKQHFKKSDFIKKATDPLTDETDNSRTTSSTVMQTVWAGLQLTYPYLIEIAKPVASAFVTNKLSGIFKKKKKNNKPSQN